MTATSLARLQRRLDADALVQLRATAAQLVAENDALREQLVAAEANADFWAREATEQHLQLCEQLCAAPGITQGGHLVAVQGAAA